jgi:enolase
MSAISSIRAREILDSRGNPTLEADVTLAGGARGRAAVPSGASTGAHEAVELRDGDPGRYGGKGVLRAVAHVNGEIAESLAGADASDQSEVDRRLIELDGTPNKARLGANALLSVSMACRGEGGGGRTRGVPLYRSTGGSDEVRTLPGADDEHPQRRRARRQQSSTSRSSWSCRSARRPLRGGTAHAGAEVFHVLKRRLKRRRATATSVGDEGGVAPDLGSNAEAIDVILAAIDAAGYRPGEDVALALDSAATELFDRESGLYVFAGSGEGARTSAELVEMYEDWIDRYPIVSIEDGLDEDDWDGWRLLTERLGDRVQLVGDDVFVTNVGRLRRGIENGIANSILIKLNQIGTVSETLETIATAKGAGYRTVISHRSGETEDTFIADLAVATEAGQIKTGSACRSERVAKYNRLLRIEEELGGAARYPGRDAYA